jgi:hypothetical protein
MKKIFLFALSIFFGFGFISHAQAQQEPNVSLDFSTYMGSGATHTELFEVTTDPAGNIYAIGQGDYSSSDFPGATPTTFGNVSDSSNVMVFKLSPDGSQLHWVTLLGGRCFEKAGYGIALDKNQNIYITGTTHSDDFADYDQDGQAFGQDTIGYNTTYHGGGTGPGLNCPGPVPNPGPEVFLIKLSPDGQNIIYGTFLGGDDGESSRGGLAVDSQGFAYVVGSTSSSNFLGRTRIGGKSDGFVVKVSQDGRSIEYAQFIGGSNDNGEHGDGVVGIQVDAQGHAYLNASAWASDAPITDGLNGTILAFDSTPNGMVDTYFVKLSPDGTQLLYATYLGGSVNEFAEHRIDIDANGNVAICGYTGSADFPTSTNNPNILKESHQKNAGGMADLYLVKLQGNIYLAGVTRSTDFETTTNAYDRSFNGDQDVFMQIYNPNGMLLYSTFIGGTEFDRARFITVDPFDNPIIVGYSQSTNGCSFPNCYPTTPGAFDEIFNNGFNPYVTKFNISWPTPPPTWKQILSNWLTPTGDQNGDGKVNSLDWGVLVASP